ncbi:hypothetical protein, partial [Burkholderia contaminans]|uniref:hypothetical protein n=1 Tax=Burkholderia contaminans TaxID=488447 RepID=UPI002D8024B9
ACVVARRFVRRGRTNAVGSVSRRNVRRTEIRLNFLERAAPRREICRAAEKFSARPGLFSARRLSSTSDHPRTFRVARMDPTARTVRH